MYSKILLALKPGSDCSGLLRTASALAVRFNAGIVVCHVSTSPGRWNGCALNLLPDDHIRELSTRIEREFRPNMSRVKQCYFLTLTGIPHVEILRLARRIQPDLIMMGSWRDPNRLQRTSGTLEQVGRNAQCPVMVVEEPFDELNFTKILAATDFSPAAGNAVDYAAQLAELSAAHLQLFHAMDETAHSPADIQKATDFAGRLYGHILKRQARITVQAGASSGPARAILEFAAEIGASLIVMGHVNPGSKEPARSCMIEVSSRAPCPVIVVNRPFACKASLRFPCKPIDASEIDPGQEKP